MKNILIIGSSGNIGTPLTAGLIAGGMVPRLAVRDAGKARQRWGTSATLADFDFTREDTFSAALAGVDAVFFVAAFPDPVPAVRTFLEAAGAAGVQRIVFSSGRTTGDVPGKPLYQIEELLRHCAVAWTILRPGWFMQNFTGWLGQSIREEAKLFLPAGDARTAFVDVRDVADVARVCLLQEGHSGQCYKLTSDEAFDHHEVCEMISKASGRAVHYHPLDRASFVRTMMDRGWTEAAAIYTADLYKYVLSGKEAEISGDIQRVLARPPRRLEAFVTERAAAFQL